MSAQTTPPTTAGSSSTTNTPPSNAPNPSTSVFTFFLITLFYFIAKYLTPDSMSTMLIIIYIIAIVSIQILSQCL